MSAVNDAPVNTVPSAQTTNEDTSLVFSSAHSNQIQIADVDDGGSSMQVALSVSHGTLTLVSTTGLSFTVGSNGAASMTFTGTKSAINTALATLTYAPTLNYNGSDTLTITTSDLGHTGSGGTLTDTDTVGITITAVDDPSSLTNDTSTVNEDNNATGNVLTNDSDVDNTLTVASFVVDGDGTTYTAGQTATITGKGTITIASDGSYTFTPSSNWNGTVPTITYTTNTGSTATLIITVTAVNDAPTSTDDSVTTSEDTAVVLSTSDFGTYSDVEGTALNKIKITTLPSAGTFEYNSSGSTWSSVSLNQEITATDITAGKLRFTPATNANGSPYTTLQFKVSDGTDYSASAYTLTVNVSAVNDAPVIVDATINLDEKSTNGYEVYDVNTIGGVTNDTDADGQSLTYSILSGNDLEVFAIDASTGKISVIDATKLDSKTTPTFNLVVRASDGTLSDNATITINVSSMNNNLTFLTRNMPPPGMGPKREVATAEENETEIETNKLTEDLDEVSIAIKPHFVKPTLVNTQLKNSVKPLKITSPEMPVKDSVKSDNNNAQQQNALNQKNETGLRNTLTPPDAMTDHKGHVTYKLPEGTFSNGHGAVSMIAVQKDGSPLPSWIKFDGVTGKISADVPKGVSAPLEIKIQATDSKGDKAETVFKIQPRIDKVSFVGKKSLSDQFKNAFDLVA